MDTDVDQRAVERAGGADDIADGDWGDDAGDIAEHIEQTAGETANLFGAVSAITAQPRAPIPLPKKAIAIKPITIHSTLT